MKLLANFLNKIIYLLNVIAVGILGLSYLAPYISPEHFWPIAFFGLLYPVFLVINIFFVFYWLVLLNKKILLSLLVIFLGWNHLNNLIVISFNKAVSDKKDFSIMSYNVKTFNAFPWAGWGEESRPKMIRLIDSIDTDIVCLQEFHTLRNIIDGKKWYNNINSILEAGYKYHHYGETSSFEEVSFFGLITFSKFPIIAKGIIKFKDSKSNACLYTDILIKEDTVRVYNLHLESIHLEKRDHSTIDNIIHLSDVTGSSWYSLFNHLRTAFTKRASQSEIISTHIASCIYPIILCGDFNDTPSSYAYRKISQQLKDSFGKGNFGLGTTYSGKLPIRIDFILSSINITAAKQQIIKEKFSDHYPLVCSFEYPE